jgi:hypothetical protein
VNLASGTCPVSRRQREQICSRARGIAAGETGPTTDLPAISFHTGKQQTMKKMMLRVTLGLLVLGAQPASARDAATVGIDVNFGSQATTFDLRMDLNTSFAEKNGGCQAALGAEFGVRLVGAGKGSIQPYLGRTCGIGESESVGAEVRAFFELRGLRYEKTRLRFLLKDTDLAD